MRPGSFCDEAVRDFDNDRTELVCHPTREWLEHEKVGRGQIGPSQAQLEIDEGFAPGPQFRETNRSGRLLREPHCFFSVFIRIRVSHRKDAMSFTWNEQSTMSTSALITV